MTLDEVFEFSKERGIQRIELFWIDLDQRWHSMGMAFHEGTLRKSAESGIHWRGSIPESPLLSEQNWKWWPDWSRVWSCPFSALPTLCILGFLRGDKDGQDSAEDARGYAARAQKQMESFLHEGQAGLYHWRGWFSLLRDSDTLPSSSRSRVADSPLSNWELAPDSFVRDFASEWSLILERTQHPLALWFTEKGGGRIGFETPSQTLLAAADQWSVLKRFARLNAEQHLWTASFLGLIHSGQIGSSVEVNLTSSHEPTAVQKAWDSRSGELSLFSIPSINSFRRVRYLLANHGENPHSNDKSLPEDQAVWQADGQMNPYLLLASLSQAYMAGTENSGETAGTDGAAALSVREAWLRAGELDFLNKGRVFNWEGINEYRRRRTSDEDMVLQIPGSGDWQLE